VVALEAKLPISYKFDRDRGITIVTCSGVLVYEDITAHWDDIYSDAQVLNGGRVLIDMRKAKVEISKAEFVKLATEDWPAEATAQLVMAIVVSSPEQFDAARQFQLLAREGSPHQIFFDRSDAIAWLKRHH
jgi:hypothetical protein